MSSSYRKSKDNRSASKTVPASGRRSNSSLAAAAAAADNKSASAAFSRESTKEDKTLGSSTTSNSSSSSSSSSSLRDKDKTTIAAAATETTEGGVRGNDDDDDANTVVPGGPVQQLIAEEKAALNFLARRGSEAERSSEEEFEEPEEAMANAERELAADAEWKRIQQNTFTRWANEHLKQANTSIANLETDLSNGLKLIALIEVLSGKRIPRYNRKPNFRSQKLENVSIALQFLEMEGITLVNIDSTDIVDCKLKLILGLIWTLILHYAISMPMWDGPPLGGGGAAGDPNHHQNPNGNSPDKTPKQRLMNWLQDKVPSQQPVGNLTKDWQDGKAVGALVDAVAPGLCPDWEDWDPHKPIENAREAMDLADKWLNVPKLLAPEELVNPNIDEQSMMTYLSQFPNAKLKPGAPLRKKTNVNKVRAYGPGLERTGLVAKAPAKFVVETFGAGDGEVRAVVTLDGRNEEEEGDFASDDDDDEEEEEEEEEDKQEADGEKSVGKGRGNGEDDNNKKKMRDEKKKKKKKKTTTKKTSKKIPCEVNFNNDRKRTFACKYFPEEEGNYRVQVFFGPRELPKSPYYPVCVEGFAGDAGKVTASGPGLEPEGVVIINKPAVFHIFATNAGRGTPEVIVLDPKGKKDSTPVRIVVEEEEEQQQEGVYRVEYIPTHVGLHSVNVFYAGNPIPKSPYGVKVSPASSPNKVWTSGRGLQPNGIRVNETVSFLVHTEEAGEGKAETKILGPGGRPLPATARQVDDFTTEFTYTPVKQGRHIIMVTFAGQEIARSPFEVTISPHKMTNIKAYGPGLKGGVVDQPAKFTVDTCGETGALGFSIKGPSQAKIKCDDNGDGSADVEYIPTAEGEYAVHILCDKEDIPGSPYMAQIIPQSDYFPDKVKVFGPGVENGVSPKETTHFTVDITDAGNAPLDIAIADELGEFKPKTKEKSREGHGGGVFDCSYQPRKNQPKQVVMVNFGGVAVPGSPYRVQNDNPNDPSKVRMHGPGIGQEQQQQHGKRSSSSKEAVRGKSPPPTLQAGKPTDFTVDCTESGPGDLQISIEALGGSSNKDLLVAAAAVDPKNSSKGRRTTKKLPKSVADNKDGTFKVSYEPTEEGPIQLVVTLDGTEVPQSPVIVNVAPGTDLSKIKLKDFETEVFVDCTNEFTIDATGLNNEDHLDSAPPPPSPEDHAKLLHCEITDPNGEPLENCFIEEVDPLGVFHVSQLQT